MSIPKIDLAYFFVPGEATQVNWSLGDKRALTLPLNHLSFTIDCLVAQTNSEWILFWDYAFGLPDEELIKELVTEPVDVWHAGIKTGLSGLPRAMNYIDPSWMYNKDASADVIHTSFRLSFRACLIKTDLLRKLGGIYAAYTSLDMSGIALGYSIFKQGGIIRYHPLLIKESFKKEVNIPIEDEWKFIREYFPKKWHIWVWLNQKNKLNNFKIWRKTRAIKYKQLVPKLHRSDKDSITIPFATVSVLVPTLDRYPYLINELEQLSQQTVRPLEVLITDQTDPSNRIALDFSKYSELNIKYFPQNDKGQCIAWNKLLEEAKGEYVLFLGDDADGITPDFIEKLLLTQHKFSCDMVASHVVELGITYQPTDKYYHISSTFPITLIKRELLLKTGFMDMFFNKNIRADHDLAMRCHLNGALMIYDPAAVVYHHRAPSGGLRAHKARVVTNFMSKNSIHKFANPTSSEIYLVKKYFSGDQYKNYIRIRYFNQLIITGSILRKLLRIMVFVIKMPSIRKAYKLNLTAAEKALGDIHGKENIRG